MTDLSLILACPACLLVGLFAGAWLHHRASRRESPVPDVLAGVKSVVDVVLRRKPKAPVKTLQFPKMRA